MKNKILKIQKKKLHALLIGVLKAKNNVYVLGNSENE